MKAYFKESNKLIINSLDSQESIIGKNFIDNINNKSISIEERKDVNDDFDGLVITVTEGTKQLPDPILGDLVFNTKVEANSVQLTFNVLNNDTSVLCDFDEDKINLFLNFLKEYCTEDPTFDITNQFKFILKHDTNEISYVIPEGMLTYFDRDKQEFITNTKEGILIKKEA